jgi:L-asparaginase/Glu-tRNA(Gln) amidotransferase subunit D
MEFNPLPVEATVQRKTSTKVLTLNGPLTMSMKRNSSYGNMLADYDEAKVLVIYTGGTIGMTRNENNGE